MKIQHKLNISDKKKSLFLNQYNHILLRNQIEITNEYSKKYDIPKNEVKKNYLKIKKYIDLKYRNNLQYKQKKYITLKFINFKNLCFHL